MGDVVSAKYRLISTAALLLAGTVTHAVAAPPTLEPGTYNLFLVVTKATGSNKCPFAMGNGYQWYVTYPGTGKSGAIARLQIDSPATALVALVDLPKTPATQGGSWKGKYSASAQPGDLLNWKGNFDLEFGVADAHSFAGMLSITGFPDGAGGTCSADFNGSGVWTGPVS